MESQGSFKRAAGQMESSGRGGGNTDYRTPGNLNRGLCEQTFKNALRDEGTGFGHKETTLAEYKDNPRRRREQVSHVFSGDDGQQERRGGKAIRYIPSNVMFNDEYFEQNPQYNPQKKARYEDEKRRKEESNKLYSDELRICPEREEGMNRKIRDTYGKNPLKILNQEETSKFNTDNRQRVSERTKVIGKYMGSAELKGTFAEFRKNRNGEVNYEQPKIVNNDMEAMSKAAGNRQSEPNYGKKHFQPASCGGGAFTYMY